MYISTSYSMFGFCSKDPMSSGDQATVRTEAAAFIIRWYQLTTVVPHPVGVGDHQQTDVVPHPMGVGDHTDHQQTNGDETFDSRKAILTILERSEVRTVF